MFKRFEVLADTPEIAIEVVGDIIEIKTPNGFTTCEPQEVMDSSRRMTWGEMEKRISSLGESPAEWIKNWHERTRNER